MAQFTSFKYKVIGQNKFVYKLFNSKKYVGILGGTFDPPHKDILCSHLQNKLDLSEVCKEHLKPFKKQTNNYK